MFWLIILFGADKTVWCLDNLLSSLCPALIHMTEPPPRFTGGGTMILSSGHFFPQGTQSLFYYFCLKEISQQHCQCLQMHLSDILGFSVKIGSSSMKPLSVRYWHMMRCSWCFPLFFVHHLNCPSVHSGDHVPLAAREDLDNIILIFYSLPSPCLGNIFFLNSSILLGLNDWMKY